MWTRGKEAMGLSRDGDRTSSIIPGIQEAQELKEGKPPNLDGTYDISNRDGN